MTLRLRLKAKVPVEDSVAMEIYESRA